MTDINLGPARNTIENGLKAGLSAKAATVYGALLEAGTPISPKNLVLRTRLHRQYVYDALRELDEKKLIVVSGEKRKVRYAAVSPDRLLQDAEKRRLDAFEGVRNLMKVYDRSPAGLIEVVRGSEAVIADEFAVLGDSQEGDTLDIVGGAGMRWVELFGERVLEWEALRKEKHIKLRYIGSGEDVRYNKEKSPVEHESRLIPGIGDIVNISIRPESVSFNFYVPEVMTVRVKSRDAVASQQALFEVLWKVAA